MKIALDISQIAYEGTGVANYTAGLVENLIKYDKVNRYLFFGYSLRKKRILADFAAGFGGYPGKIEFRLFSLPQSAVSLLGNYLHRIPLEKLIGKVDLYHSSDWVQFPSFAPGVTTVHDLVVYRHPETSHQDIIRTQKIRLRRVKNSCRRVFADSRATKKDLVDILDFDPSMISVVYPGVADNFRKVSPLSVEKVLKKYSLSSPFILAVGKSDPRKNIARTVEAYTRSGITALLVIVSSGGWGGDLPEAKNVRRLTGVALADLPALYSAAEFFVYPSLFEGFGLPVIEANKCACPVITSKGGSLAEVAGNAALFVNPASVTDIAAKMGILYRDKKLRSVLAEEGLRNAARFTWENAARQIISVYEKIHLGFKYE